MKTCFSFFVLTLLIGIIMIVFGTVLGIVYRKKCSPLIIVVLLLLGIVVALISIVMCLCLGFFMR